MGKTLVAAPSRMESVVSFMPGVNVGSSITEPQKAELLSVEPCDPQGSITKDVRAVFAENARLRTENQRLRGEVYKLQCLMDAVE